MFVCCAHCKEIASAPSSTCDSPGVLAHERHFLVFGKVVKDQVAFGCSHCQNLLAACPCYDTCLLCLNAAPLCQCTDVLCDVAVRKQVLELGHADCACTLNPASLCAMSLVDAVQTTAKEFPRGRTASSSPVESHCTRTQT